MIAVRRARHFAIWLALAVLLPVFYLLALRSRPRAPVQPELPAAVETFADDTRSTKAP